MPHAVQRKKRAEMKAQRKVNASLWEDLLFKNSREEVTQEELNFFCDPPLCSHLALSYKMANEDNMMVLVRTVFFINSICQQTMLKSPELIQLYEGFLNTWTMQLADIQERSKLSGKYIATKAQLQSLKDMYPRAKELITNTNKGIVTKAYTTACAETRAIFGRSN